MIEAANRSAYRSLGRGHRVGVGFMNKPVGFQDHGSANYSLVYVLRGTGVYADAKGSLPLRAGSVFQRVPNWRHATTVETEWLECHIALPATLFHSLNEMGILPNGPHVQDVGLNPALVRRYGEAVDELKDATERMLPGIIGRLTALIADTLADRHDNRDMDMVEVACQTLGTDLATRMSIPELCVSNGWGYERFRKIFRRHVGISPGQYRIRRRIDAACELLHDNDFSIAEVADCLGYPSQYEFSGQFKRHTGKSPSYYRKNG